MPAEIETAVTAVLGELLDGILFDQMMTSTRPWTCSNRVRKGGRSWFHSKWMEMERANSPSLLETDCLGIAADLIKAPVEFSALIRALLGNVLVVRDRRTARRLVKELSKDARIVTLKGEVFWGSGMVAAGQEGRAGLISGRARNVN